MRAIDPVLAPARGGLAEQPDARVQLQPWGRRERVPRLRDARSEIALAHHPAGLVLPRSRLKNEETPVAGQAGGTDGKIRM